MPYWPDSYSMQSFVNRERYLFVFRTIEAAQAWFDKFVEKFGNESIFYDRKQLKISFPDAFYRFTSKAEADKVSCQEHFQEHYRWGLEEICIILDHPGRHYVHILGERGVTPDME